MTLEEFEAKYGKSTDPADLDRVNCTQGGTCGHSQCGLCEHGTPRFLKCEACKADVWRLRWRGYNQQVPRIIAAQPKNPTPTTTRVNSVLRACLARRRPSVAMLARRWSTRASTSWSVVPARDVASPKARFL